MAHKFLSWVKNNKACEFFRFTIAGLLFASLDLLFLYFLVAYLNIWYLLATTISFSTITLAGFFIQKRFTFKDESENNAKQIVFFVLISGIGLLLNTIFMYIFVGFFGLWYVSSNIITKGVIILWNFFGNKYITFNNTHGLVE